MRWGHLITLEMRGESYCAFPEVLFEYLQGTHLRCTKCGRRSPNHLETAKGNLKEVPPTALRGLISRLSLRRHSVGASKAGEASLELRMLVYSDGQL